MNNLQELSGENRALKTDLTEKQIEMTLIKAELARLRTEYEEKLKDMALEKDELVQTLGQQSNVHKQLQLMLFVAMLDHKLTA